MKRSHPAFRLRGTLSQAEYEAQERAANERRQREANERHPKREAEAAERTARWLSELE